MIVENEELIKNLIDGKLTHEELYRIISGDKDPGRFKLMLKVLQERVGWDEKIILPVSDRLFIVCKDGKPVVKCSCGFEFGDYRENWKLKARIYVRDNEEAMKEIYKEYLGANPEWTELREYYCPRCYALLEVEAVPAGYPVIFDFLPDIKTFYQEWLGEELPCEDLEFKDLSWEYLSKIIGGRGD
jgi:acetone carboxylase gamma subunit